MKIKVKVKTNSKEEKVNKLSENEYKIWVKEPAKENKANYAVIDLMSDTLDVPKNSIQIKRGLKSRIKILEI